MHEISNLVQGGLKPGVYLLNLDLPAIEIQHVVEQAGFSFFYLDGKRIRNKEELFAQAKVTFNFPNYFGDNWEAFSDCLTDMSWMSISKGEIVLYDDFHLFAQSDGENFTVALEALQYATQVVSNYPMYVVLRGNQQFAPEEAQSLSGN